MLNFTSADSGSANAPVKWRKPGETPIVSGGVPVSSGWKNVSGNLWQTQLPANTQPFEYLFYNGQRRLRSRVAGASGVGYYVNDGRAFPPLPVNLWRGRCATWEPFCASPLKSLPAARMLLAPASQIPTGLNPSAWIASGIVLLDPISDWINLNASASTCGGARIHIRRAT